MIKKSSRPLMEAWHPTPEQQKKIGETDATFEWLCQQPGRFFLPYAGQWVGAQDCRIVAASESYEGLVKELEKNRLDPERVLIHYVRRPGLTIYL